MGTLRVEPTRVQAWASRSATAVWNVFDIQLVIYPAFLAVVGLMMAYTNSDTTSPLTMGTTFARGLIWLAVAIVAFTAATAFDYRWLKTFAWPIYLVNIALLVASRLIGTGVGGVSRWVTIFGLQFQFSEICKILMIVVLANYLSGRGDRLRSLSTIVGAGILVAPPLVLVMIQPDLGTSLVFGAVLLGTLFLSGASARWLGVAIGTGIAMLPLVWAYVLLPFQKQRILSFLDPSADPDKTYQLQQSMAAVRAGGLFGNGLSGGGALDRLPVGDTDFAFAVVIHALGVVGGLVVFLLFAALLWRVLLVGWRSDDRFGLVFSAGVASMLLFQLLVNAGMVIGIMPITGIPLPFITHGGASLVSIAIGLGVLQSINLRQAKPKW